MESNYRAIRGSSGVRLAFGVFSSVLFVFGVRSHFGTDPDQTVPTQPKADQ